MNRTSSVKSADFLPFLQQILPAVRKLCQDGRSAPGRKDIRRLLWQRTDVLLLCPMHYFSGISCSSACPPSAAGEECRMIALRHDADLIAVRIFHIINVLL
jgi:hypothetical protein